jgi:hypothetical protein
MRSMRSVGVLLALCVSFASARAEARRTTVSALGQARLGPHHTPLERAQAINQALRHAVEQAVELAGGPAEGEDPQTDKLVYDRLAELVQRTAVIGERVEGGMLTVELSVDVDLDALDAALGGRRGVAAAWMNARHDEPSGRRVSIVATPPELEAVVAGAFTDAGFRVTAGGADLTVVARGVVKSGARSGEVWAAEARVTAELERAGDHRPIARAAHAATQLHVDAAAAQKNALLEAARVTAAELARKLDR